MDRFLNVFSLVVTVLLNFIHMLMLKIVNRALGGGDDFKLFFPFLEMCVQENNTNQI